MKEINIEKLVRNILIILTIISFTITILVITNTIYNDFALTNNNYSLNNIITDFKFEITFWIDNILIYLFSIIYIILGIKSKQEVVLKIFFSLFSVLSTIVVITLIMNFIAKLYGIF